ncbi:MAG: endonuclease/exonuclease/phosphatase family protein [Polyangiaceae bacterium]
MTYNVRYFGHPVRGVFSTRRGIARIARTIAAMDPLPDVVCLQEVETRSLRARRTHAVEENATQLDALTRSLDHALEAYGKGARFDAYYFSAHDYRLTSSTSIYTTGLAVLARSDLSVLEHNAHAPHDITHRSRLVGLKQTRICGHVAFESRSGDRLDVFNTHLSLPSFLEKRFWTEPHRMGFGPNQLREAHELARFIHRTRKSDHYIVAGDFNSLPGSPVDEFLRTENDLVDAYQAVRDTHPARARAFPTAGFMSLRMHIDHLYASRSIDWLDMDGTHAFGSPGDFDGLSDHVPLIARLRLRA